MLDIISYAIVNRQLLDRHTAKSKTYAVLLIRIQFLENSHYISGPGNPTKDRWKHSSVWLSIVHNGTDLNGEYCEKNHTETWTNLLSLYDTAIYLVWLCLKAECH